MPLDLKDPRWSEVPGSYGHSRDVVAWLAEAVETKTLAGERLGDLINEVGHQGDASLAIYAVVPYLVDLACSAETRARIELLTHAGLLCASTGRPKAPSCPNFLLADYREAAKVGAEMLAPLLSKTETFEGFKYAVAGLAGFLGHTEFGLFLEPLELYQDQFHHPWLEQPIPANY
jgi:hypothetical protein